MRYRHLLALAVGCLMLSACEGLKEALTAHVDVVARAASQELSVTRLADLIGNAKVGIPVTKENAGVVADLWRNYQLMGYAAARGDSLKDKKAIDQAVLPMTNNARLTKFMDSVFKTVKGDSGSEAAYNSAAGNLLAARHILFKFPDNATPAQKDSVKKRAAAILPQVNAANFADMAKKYSGEPAAKTSGGSLGVFPKDQMVPVFSNAVSALKPGQISGLVESQFGYHIIQRQPYADAKAQFQQQYQQLSLRSAESTYVTNVEKSADIQVKANAPAAAKAAAADPAAHHKDNTTLATFKGGDLTVAQYLGWLTTFPPQSQIAQQLQQAPDSIVKSFLKTIATRQVLLAKADSAHVTMPADEQAQLYGQFSQMITTIWQALGVDPKTLADSGKSTAERERLAAAHVETFLDRILANQGQPIGIPAPLQAVLQDKYESSVNAAGIDRAVERGLKVRAAADSARAANQPKSQVPLPGGRPTQPPPPATPAPKPK